MNFKAILSKRLSEQMEKPVTDPLALFLWYTCAKLNDVDSLISLIKESFEYEG